MIVPEVILGVSLLILFVTIGLQLGYTTIIISHVTFCFPFVMAAVQARLAGLDPSLEEAALDLGATPFQAFTKVLVPYLMPAIVSGALMSFTLSLDELIVTYFTASAGDAHPAARDLRPREEGARPVAQRDLDRVHPRHRGRRGAHRGAAAPEPLIADRKEDSMTRFPVSRARRARRPDRPRRPAAAGRSAADEELNLFAWSEYVPQSVIDGFTKETGIQVNYETYASNEEMLAKLALGRRELRPDPAFRVHDRGARQGEAAPEARLVEAPEPEEHREASTKNLPHDPAARSTACRRWRARSASSSTPRR